jgi:4-hydroxy-4-methyl-2-oxoglutarate aldolase
VADAKGYTEAGAWGEIMAVAAKERRIAGLVFNGAVRDSEAIIRLGFSIFCCGLSIKGTEKISLGYINHPLIIDNVTIIPGDLVLGDADGVVIVKMDEAEEVYQKSLTREEKEALFKEQLRKGYSTLDLAGFSEILKMRGLTEEIIS